MAAAAHRPGRAAPTGSICDPVIDGMVVKWDATHLTATFARAISADIERALDDVGVLP